MGASREARAEACGEAWGLLAKKWTPVPGGLAAAFGADAPLGLWREVARGVHGADLPSVV